MIRIEQESPCYLMQIQVEDCLSGWDTLWDVWIPSAPCDLHSHKAKLTSLTSSTLQLRTNRLKAMNTAVNAAVQIEPFKFFHKINESVCDYREPLQYSNSQFLNAGGVEGRSTRPAGIAHLGESLLFVLFSCLFVCVCMCVCVCVFVPRIECRH
jgi:hypothetical protein